MQPYYCTKCGHVEHLEKKHRTMYLCPAPCFGSMIAVHCHDCTHVCGGLCGRTNDILYPTPQECACGDWAPAQSWAAALPV